MFDTIYNDLLTKALPKISEGLSITKEYFGELFGRYVKFLIISDVIDLIFSLLTLSIGIHAARKMKAGYDADKTYDKAGWIAGIVLGAIVTVASLFAVFYDLSSIAKDYFIPEVRVYEQITSINHRADLRN